MLQSVLREKCERIAFKNGDTVCVQDLKLVMNSFYQSRNEKFPDPALDELAHRVNSAVPAVELTHHRKPAGVGCPHPEAASFHSVELGEVSSKPLVQGPVLSLGK